MHGPGILSSFLSSPTTTDKWGTAWQYNSWSDNHSKVACWGLFFDLLMQSSVLRGHVEDDKVVFGVNYTMRDFSTGRRKKLDLVIARPAREAASKPRHRTLTDLAQQWTVPLTPTQAADLGALPVADEGPIGAVLMAMEAKAAMTAHQKSLPRLYDELNSSHLTVHGASSQALAVGLVMVNHSPTFISPKLNSPPPGTGSDFVVSTHAQPFATQIVLDKAREIPRRSSNRGNGFDALACIVIDCPNDGTVTRLVTAPPAPQAGDSFEYETTVVRIGNEYDGLFNGI